MSLSWDRIGEAFARARELPPGREREAWLHELAGEDGELAREVRSLLGAEGSAGDFLEVGPASSEPSAEPGAMPVRIGPFRLLRRIAAGGMGVVYEAEQDRPSRRVALKLLPRSWSSEREQQRFQHEAEILASLEHPSIARVYAAGTATDDRGEAVSYIAMELVPGALSILDYAQAHDLDRPARLDLFRRACAAIEHAHQKGVLHRDIKPENLLVDSGGALKVIDFGIARSIDAGESGLTGSGELVGTLRYLSPEQADGRRPDVRSDVYALGLVLHELLLGRPAYDLSGSLSQVLEQVRSAPPELRRGELDDDLATIVRVALEKQPEDRHASVGVLRADIERFLSSRPILSRTPTRLRRARLWVRRHRAAATAVALIGATLITAAVVSIGFGLEAERARRAESIRAEQEARARRSLETAYRRSRELSSWVLRDLYDALEGIPGTLGVRERLVERFRTHLDELSSAHAPSRLELARAWSRLGDLLGGGSPSHLGRTEEALASYRRAVELYESLAEEADTGGVAVELVSVLLHLASLQLEAGRGERAAATLDRARARLEGVWPVEERAQAAWARVELARIEARLAAAGGHVAEARAAHERALALAEPLAASHRDSTLFALTLASVHADLASFLADRSEEAAAARHFERFLDIVRALPPTEEDLAARHDRAHYLIVAADFIYSHDVGRALALYRTALDLRERLVESAPEDAALLRALTVAQERVGWALIDLDRPKEAIELLERCLRSRQELVRRDPANRERVWELASAHEKLGDAWRATGEDDQALEQWEKGVERYQALIDQSPDYTPGRRQLAFIADRIGDLLVERSTREDAGEDVLDSAQAWYRKALEQLEALEAADALPSSQRSMLEEVQRKLSEVR